MIMDGNNPSPNYPASKTINTSGNAVIMDGNNPSPNYPASVAAPAPRRHAKRS
jgi:hypothetical protein